MMSEYETKMSYKLNDEELAEIEVIQNVFKIMDEPLDIQSTLKTAKYIVKDSHEPADIMNIMNISMRRFVKVAKCLPSFKEIADESKFYLLKCNQILFVKYFNFF